MTDPSQSETLTALAEAWLAQRNSWFGPRLPAALLVLYEREKGRARFRADVILCCAGVAVLAIFYPLLRASLPAGQRTFDAVYLGLLAPCVMLSLVVVLRRPGPLLREFALAAPSLLAMLLLTYLFMISGGTGSVLFVAAALMLMLFVTISVHLRFDLAVGWMVVAQCLFGFGIGAARDISRPLQYDVVLIGLVCGAYMLLANRRMHGENHRGFVFSLREQLRQDALTAENRTLDALARRDPLTGLANRRAYDQWLSALWLQAASGTVGLIMIDVDHFKLYNDFYGHPAGDACLATVGACLREQLRGTSDQVARIGGEEFAVLLPGVGLSQCGDIAERLRQAIETMELPHLGDATGAVLTISCGCASLRVRDATPAELCAAADSALYQAKQSGRNHVCLGELARAPAAAGTG